MPTKTKKNQPVFEHLGSLITYKDGDADQLLGYLIHDPERGVYDAALGRVEVSPEHATVHNAELTKALIAGLDNQCQVGQHGMFYFYDATSPVQIRAFTGEVIADYAKGEIWFEFKNKKTVVFFSRGAKVFRGTKPKENDAFFFKRVK